MHVISECERQNRTFIKRRKKQIDILSTANWQNSSTRVRVIDIKRIT